VAIEGSAAVLIPVRRCNDVGTVVTVDYATSDDSATAGQDYVATSGTLMLGAGETNLTISLAPVNDGLVEGVEHCRITLSNPSAGALLGSRFTTLMRIYDNDTGPYFSSATLYTVEDIGWVMIRVNRGDDGDQPVTVDYLTVDGTAVAGTDYTAANGTLSFAGGEAFKEIPVVILNDGTKDPDKTFQLQLANASSGGVGNPSLVNVIIQDPTPVIHTQPTPVSQSVSMGPPLTIGVSAKGARMQWQHRVGNSPFTDIPGATNQVLEWKSPNPALNGDYRFIVANSTGDSVISEIAAVLVDPTFIKTFEGPIVTDVESTVSAARCDYDKDGWPDVLAANRPMANSLYRNNRDGTFSKVYNAITDSVTVWAGLWADYDNDGDLESSKPQTCGHPVKFSAAPLSSGFKDSTERGAGKESGKGARRCMKLKRGVGLRRASLDLFVPDYYSANVLYRNGGDGTFAPVDVGSPMRDGCHDECTMWVDYDRDGFVDLFVASGEGPPSPNLLYRNHLPASGNTNRWLQVELEGTTSNRDGIGAKIRVKATIAGKEVRQLRQIVSNGAFSDGCQLRAHFGLGDATNITTLRIEWPSGTVQELPDVSANQILTVVEPRRPILTATVKPDRVEGTLSADPNTACEVSVCDTLGGWVPSTTVTTDAAGVATRTDMESITHPCRFYRAARK
jgi:hypothetical protein